MKILNFTAKEILPALLRKAKTQTIRAAFEYKSKGILVDNPKYELQERIEKPARFKVGDKVQLMWNQRSKYQWFCTQCGLWTLLSKGLKSNCHNKTIFNKHLVNVVITEVFKIMMGKEMDGYYLSVEGLPAKWWLTYAKTQPIIKDVYPKDGFKSAEQMFAYFY